MRGWLARLIQGPALPEQDDEAVRRRTLVLAASIITPLASVWTVTYWLLGLPRSAAIPFAYQLVSAATLLYHARTSR